MAESNPTHPAGIDREAIREAARNMQDGPVTAGYKGDREAVIKMLNDARMRRGAGQGCRPDRHGKGLEPVRVRQRLSPACGQKQQH